MTPERLQRIRAVYEAAIETPAPARSALLQRECDGDADLRQEVERLLGARERLPNWLADPLVAVANATPAEVHSTMTQALPASHVSFPPGVMPF